MDTLIEALEAEITKLKRQYDLEVQRGQQMLSREYTVSYSTHLGHNLANVATELSGIAAKIESTTMILNDLRFKRLSAARTLSA